MTNPADVERTFGHWLSAVRRRWWARRALEALAFTAGMVAVAAAVGIAWMAWAWFDETAVAAARIAVYASVALALLVVLLPRLLRRLSRLATARYVEARTGNLDALIVSAVEAGERARTGRHPVRDGSLEHALLTRAATAGAGSDAVRRLEFTRMRRAGAGLAVIVLAAGALALWGSAPMQHGLALLLAPGADATAGNPYRLAVRPGDVTRVAGDDQAITALPEGFRPQSVELMTRAPGERRWTRTPMAAAGESGDFQALLADLEGPREYYVRSGPIESSRHTIEVTPRPQVSRIDLRYEYPERTGRAPELVRDGGPIEAVRGTRVELRIIPQRPARAGELVVDGERRIPLQPAGGELRATLTLEQDGRYRIELPAGAAGLVAASTEHSIQVHEDEHPTVAFEWPGRDTRVTSIQEVEIAIRAEDDVAVRELELVLNVNGAEDRVIPFDTGPATPTTARGTHVLALEKLSLAPGDLISYYARVRDAPNDPERVVTTDLYFMDVRPFEQHFTRASGGGGGGGGQGQADPELTAQQRSLVVALFKLERDRNTLEEPVLHERLQTLEEAQARIRDRVEAIARRIGSRAFVSGNESYRTIAEELPRASRAMREAESRLAIRESETALVSARQALLHLQRADAAFRDVQVAMNQGGGGGQNDGSQQQLANLFQLEMDKFRNQYEELQRGRWNAPDQSVEETLAKLRELARRQQREIERLRLRGDGGSGMNSQQALAEEVEALQRELERLTRHRDQAQAARAERAVEQLRSARRAMERAGRTGDAEAGQEALERLRDLRRDLESTRRGTVANGTGSARDQRGGGEPAVGEESLEQLRAMVRGLKADQQRLADAATGGAPRPGQQRGGNEPGPGGSEGQSGRQGGANQPGGAANGGGGGATAGGGIGGPVGGYEGGYDGSYYGGYDLDWSDLRQQTLERMRQLDALRDAYPDIGDARNIARNVEAVISSLDRLGEEATAEELRALREHHADLFAQIQRLEARLRNAPEQEQPEALTARQRVDIAPRYQDPVERYYRNLSEQPVTP